MSEINYKLILHVVLLLGGVLSLLPGYAEEKVIVFSTAPTHTPAKSRQLYQPILDFLEKETGRKFILKPAVNFTDYNNKLQNNEYDFVFDGPHFVAWRMKKYKHIPLVRFPGKIKIVVVMKKYHNIKTLKDLHGKRVCAFPSPNMMTMSFLQFYPNPLRQPVITPARGFKGLEKCLARAEVYAAVLRDSMWKKIKDKSAMAILSAPQNAYPERTFSISNTVSKEVRDKIKSALLSEQAKPALAGLMKTFRRKSLIEAKAEEYKDLDMLLAPVWGFQ